MAIQSINPASNQVLETFEELSTTQVSAALERAREAFDAWRRTGFGERAALLHRAAALLRDEAGRHARHMVLEMGKPLVQAEAEVEKCAWVCEFYAEHAERFLSPEPVETDAARSYVRYDPLGTVLAVMPWNFPYWQVFRAAAPALMAGNAMLLKHASNVPRCALEIQEIFARAAAPQGVFQTLLVGAGAVAGIVEHPAVVAATLTGSDPAGRALAETAGRRLKKTVLELGGSDPFIVLDDVNVDAVARQASVGRTLNSGQSCIAAKRFLIHEAVADRFAEAFGRELEALRVGDPLERETDVGPLARPDLVDELDDQVRRAVAAGAVVATGGRRLDGPGCFYAPTLLVDVARDNPAAREETFGPVAALLRVRDEDEAVEVANDSEFGLGASVWSGDPARAEALAPRIEAGHVAVNGVVKSDPRLPFGGVKNSGYGRELSSFGIREFVNVKSVWVGPSSG
ncbi:MAG: NAD-dependent succinate-semialdehyde dehydrogenase [Deltaproteobacteria bacterium]|nr:NAD-dependent succinate-semialdehyde dehydrogenase [Deltaproteobacteria bacterium]